MFLEQCDPEWHLPKIQAMEMLREEYDMEGRNARNKELPWEGMQKKGKWNCLCIFFVLVHLPDFDFYPISTMPVFKAFQSHNNLMSKKPLNFAKM